MNDYVYEEGCIIVATLNTHRLPHARIIPRRSSLMEFGIILIYHSSVFGVIYFIQSSCNINILN